MNVSKTSFVCYGCPKDECFKEVFLNCYECLKDDFVYAMDVLKTCCGYLKLKSLCFIWLN